MMKNKEDFRFITGRGNYVDDVRLPGTLYASFVRSPYAHAAIKGIDTSEALKVPGVKLILTGPDLAKNLPPLFPTQGGPGMKKYTRCALSIGKVRCVGEPVAAVIADDRYIAEDGAELLKVDYAPLPPLIEPEKVKQEKQNLMFEGWEDNILMKQNFTSGDVDAAFKQAHKVLKLRVGLGRACGAAMEGRGVLANYDPRTENLTMWVTSQGAHNTKRRLGPFLKLDETKVRVIAPDVGGGFGVKGGNYLEQVTCGYASIQLGRPVKWMETRRESITCSQHGRDQVHDMEVAVSAEGKILGFKHNGMADVGSPLFMNIASVGTAVSLIPGCYKINDFVINIDALATNKGPTGPVRGNGKPEGIHVIERVMDEVARELKLDPVDVRKQNFIQANEFPYRTGTNHFYDSGDYPGALDRLLSISNYKKLKEEQENLRREGRCIGIGIASFLDAGGFGPSKHLPIPGYERASVRVEGSGKVTILSGVHGHGQTLETTLSKICSDELTIGLEDINVIMGDTSLVPTGVGTFGSRSCAVGGSAVHLATKKVREKMILIAANMLEVEPDKIDLAAGVFNVKGNPEKTLPFKDVAYAATNMVAKLPQGMEPGLEGIATFDPPGRVYGSGSHLAQVEVDPESGYAKILKYYAVDDGGKIINHSAVEGQIIGGAAHGIGNALMEELVYGEDGQLLSASFMDYLLPTALEVPSMVLEPFETLSPNNPLGVKGVGESGTIGALSSVANAVADAIAPLGARIPDVPLTPEKVWKAIKQASTKA